MKNYSSDNHDNESLFNRRKMLSVLGVAGLSTVSASVVAGSKDIQKKTEKSPCFIYGSVVEMKQDRSLKEGDCIETKGYYGAGDGGHAKYQVVKASEQVDEGEFIALRGGLTGQLINVDTVNYRMFGAKSDGNNDDGVQIKLAHGYANKHDIPVENPAGSFWIKETKDILVQTDVKWGRSAFYIDEKYNTSAHRFRVKGKEQSTRIILSPSEKKSFLEKLKLGIRSMPELAKYNNCLVVITDDNDKIGARSGKNPRAKMDFFYVEELGRVVGQVYSEFSDYTSLTAYPAEESYLVIDGGTFFLSGEQTTEQAKGYVSNGIQIARSRTIIKNQWVGLEKGKKDDSIRPRNGFFSLSRVFDVQIENVRLLPWEKTRPEGQPNVPAGTYGISGRVMMNVLLRNVVAEGTEIHWGVFGTNYIKDFTIERCRLNRFDVHSYGWNITIKDSEIGQKGVTVTGGGMLHIENTTSYHPSRFVSFRPDYGSKWDGDVLIKNCAFYPSSDRTTAVLNYVTRSFDFHYPIGYANRIKIEDFTIDYKSAPASTAACWVIYTSEIKSYAEHGKLFFPSEIEVKNVAVRGRSQGVRLMPISKPNTYLLKKDFLYNALELKSNARLIFENIHLEEPVLGRAHFSLARQDDTLEDKALVPFIRFKDCENLICDMRRNTAKIEFENCVISNVGLSPDNDYKGEVLFTNCKFKPYSDKASIAPGAVLGTSFVNCVLMLPEQPSADAPLGVYRFMELNKSVKYNHVNTRLGKDVLAWSKGKGIKLSPEFINQLKSHHELED